MSSTKQLIIGAILGAIACAAFTLAGCAHTKTIVAGCAGVLTEQLVQEVTADLAQQDFGDVEVSLAKRGIVVAACLLENAVKEAVVLANGALNDQKGVKASLATDLNAVVANGQAWLARHGGNL